MSISSQVSQLGALQMGQNGRTLEWGQFTFNSTDASGNLKSKLRRIESITFQEIGGAADERCSPPAPASDGAIITNASTGVIAVTRTGASKTSGLKVMYIAIGW